MKPRIGITVTPAVHEEKRIERLNRSYVEAVLRAGGLPFMLPILEPGEATEVLANLDGLLLTGGGDVAPWCYQEEPVPEVYGVDPSRDDWELALLAAADSAQMPVLGVCRGEQLINVAFGGTLVQHLPRVTGEQHRQVGREDGPSHPVALAPSSRLASTVGADPLVVNTLHHQAVARVGAGLRAVAWAPDGVIEAVESSEDRPIIGVQWHPEWLIDLPRHGRLFLWLTQTAAAGRADLAVPESFAPDSSTADPGRPPSAALVDDLA